jgi:hypothetical protein
MNSSRPIVPARPVSDSSIARSPIIPRKVVVPAPAPVVARAAVVHAHPSNEYVLEDELYRSPQPHPVRLGDVVGTQLTNIAREIEVNTHRRRVLEDITVTDSCYVGGVYTRSRRRIRVEYKRNTRPEPLQAFSEEEILASPLRIAYPKGKRFGETSYLELKVDAYATEHVFNEKSVPILEKGMYAEMFIERRTRSFDRWIYRPCTRDGYILQDLDLVGKFTGQLLEKQSADQLESLRDVDWKAITINDIKYFLCVIDFSHDDGTGFEIILVLDRERKVRCIVHDKEILSDPDSELDRE